MGKHPGSEKYPDSRWRCAYSMDVRGWQLIRRVPKVPAEVRVRARARMRECMCAHVHACVYACVRAVVFLALIDLGESAAEFHNQPRVTTLSEM